MVWLKRILIIVGILTILGIAFMAGAFWALWKLECFEYLTTIGKLADFK